MINERKLSKSELDKREDIIMKMKKNKKDLVKKYGKDAEAVMYGRATNMAKKQTKEMRDPKITELIKDALRKPMKEANAFIVAADKARDAGKKEFEFPKGSGKMHKVTIKKDLKVDEDLESGQYGDPKVGNYDITSQSDNEASDIEALAAAGLEEDIDIGHEDNEPGMLQGDLYEIGKASMEIYAMLDDMEGEGEVDLPSWWQSKIYKAKEAIVGAAEYLDFELKEPAIDAVVDKVMPLDIEVDPLGETVEDYITSVNDLSEEELSKRDKNTLKKISKELKGAVKAHGGQAKKIEKIVKEVDVPASLLTKMAAEVKSAKSMAQMMINLYNAVQDKEAMDYSKNQKFSRALKFLKDLADDQEVADEKVDEMSNADSNYGSNEGSNENSNDNPESYSGLKKFVAEKLARNLKEGLPKGFFDKAMKGKDEVDEVAGFDRRGKKEVEVEPSRFKGRDKGRLREDEVDESFDSLVKKVDKEKGYDKEDAKRVAGFIANRKRAGAGSGPTKKMKKREKIKEDYASLVSKLKKQGKSEKAAKAIAGAMASYKAKGGGKGPTAKQAKRAK